MTMLISLDEIAAYLGVPAESPLQIQRTGSLIPACELSWDASADLVRVRAPLRLESSGIARPWLAHVVAEINRALDVVGIEVDPDPVYVTHAFADDDGIATTTIDRLVQAVDECERQVRHLCAGAM